ncbi:MULTISPECIES: DUF885 domain-containing protein [unclassified Colwellia]|uniref:DUF885 domain-containing protein n=1 Tax=unclassified Colwellia TaxID=196834 RepID=UPI000D37156C|nr:MULTISPECIES: DUF885 domain-containing protein [unclassified Colwellia]AWB57344.1 DUF885 domain-containing protein [Colwellia sp. Arc7-D]MBA6415305.1 DUF885 domain-containing protein [Colwellia sp. 6M3]|tara:strand:- start:16440 stop:18293 length:1854 start_codon:yes stop_codon:yes gene_type:complete
MTFNKSLIVISITALLAAACSNETTTQAKGNNALAMSPTEKLNSTVNASKAANELFDTIFMEGVNRNPVRQTYLGIKIDYDKWQDLSEENSAKELAFAKEALQRIQVINVNNLDKQTKLSFQLLTQKLEQQIADYPWRHHNYPVNQMFGVHSQIPALLINQHSIKDTKQAYDYIARVKNSKVLLEQLIDQLEIRANKGIIAPKFVFGHVIRDSKNLTVGAPFDNGADSTLYADFTSKIDKLDITDTEKQALTAKLSSALTTEFKAGYQALVSYLVELEKKADTTDGAWKFPNGDKFYNNALKRTTTTNLTADEIHKIGLDEVARIHDEMRVIMKKVNYKGTLSEFFQFMRHDPQFYYAGDDAGRERYLTEATALINTMKGELDQLFITKPKADLKVKKVEAFREKSAGKAFYQQPAPDGSRPGIYYANLYDMEAMPTYQMEALAYHEGIPGHHMQIALKQELEGIPKFRKFGGYTAYSEGWGLYSEMIPKEIGFYQDPYSDFGRLAMELWRACRLVVDTGIHNKKWNLAQGIEYYVSNTPNAKSDAIKMVERHVVMPSQATAYKIGMLKIVELRTKAKQQLGDKFDIREFHDVVLTNGAVPLNVLEDMVNDYIVDKS